MRDLLLTLFIFGSVPFILRRPVVGVFVFTWISLMSPHRLTWGFAYNLPFAFVIAIATLVGILFSREPKQFPVTPTTVTLVLMIIWMNVSTLFAFDVPGSMLMWDKVIKIQFFILVTLYLLHTKQHIITLAIVVTLSIGYFAVKGGVFTLLLGGEHRVYGPEGSFIEENNAMALASVMLIPLLRYLQLQATKRWIRLSLLGAMVLCGFSVLGSHSRGGFLAVAAMLGFLWLKGRHKVLTLIGLLMLVPIGIGFMPDKWEERMTSIQNYEEDASAQGRINAWLMAWNLVKDRPLVGGGFEIYTPEVFARYAPNPLDIHSSHSIYFQMLGEHGIPGLLLFLLLWWLVWRNAAWIVRAARQDQRWRWAGDLASMVQVSLVGYAVGGAFLGLAYFDLPYNLLVLIVLTKHLMEKEASKRVVKPGGLRGQSFAPS